MEALGGLHLFPLGLIYLLADLTKSNMRPYEGLSCNALKGLMKSFEDPSQKWRWGPWRRCKSNVGLFKCLPERFLMPYQWVIGRNNCLRMVCIYCWCHIAIYKAGHVMVGELLMALLTGCSMVANRMLIKTCAFYKQYSRVYRYCNMSR